MLLSNMELLATAPGGVAKLRELILTLAVQGKLVPQDPADEPAGVLLQKIRAEKDRLVAEGKIKRDKPLAEIGEEEKPFELPVGWEWVKGSDLFSVVRGVTYQKSDAKDAPSQGLLPILRANNIRGSINFDDLVYVPASLVSDDQLLRPGDYVVCLASGSKSLVGKAAPFRPEIACSFGAFCGAIRPFTDAAYFAVYLASPMYRESVAEASAGIGINNLKGSSLLGLDIALPPLAEQSRIVTRVEALMRLCDALEAKGQLEAAQHAQLVSTLLGTLTASTTPEELAAHWQRVAQHFDLLLDRPEAIDALEQTLLQLAVRGLLVPQDPTDEPASALLQKIRAEKDLLIATGQIKRDKPLPPVTDEEKPFELPVGWEWVRLGDIAQANTGFAFKSGEYTSHGTLVFRVTNIKPDGSVDLTDVKYIDAAAASTTYKNFLLNEGDVLLVMVGGSLGKIGVVERHCLPAVLNQNMWKIVSTDDIDRRYLIDVLRYVNAHQLKITNSTHGHLAQGEYLLQPVALPPAAEQCRIVTRVTALRRVCADLRQRLQAAQTTQSHLAQALVESSNAL